MLMELLETAHVCSIMVASDSLLAVVATSPLIAKMTTILPEIKNTVNMNIMYTMIVKLGKIMVASSDGLVPNST